PWPKEAAPFRHLGLAGNDDDDRLRRGRNAEGGIVLHTLFLVSFRNLSRRCGWPRVCPHWKSRVPRAESPTDRTKCRGYRTRRSARVRSAPARAPSFARTS